MANGEVIDSGEIERTAPYRSSQYETQDIGVDEGTSIDDTYRAPCVFTGGIGKFTVELK